LILEGSWESNMLVGPKLRYKCYFLCIL